MIIILILALSGFLFLAYLFVAGAAKSNYYFWSTRCKGCVYFKKELLDEREIFCNINGFMNVDEMETCQDYKKKGKNYG